jgi:hypothetical protein
MSSTKSFHWREVEKSEDLQLLLQLLKDADGPLSGVDISESSRPYLGAKPRLANVVTLIAELKRNPGYDCAGGLAWGRFPDGLYKYWLVTAPGWRPRWIVNDDYKILPYMEGIDLRTRGHRIENKKIEQEPVSRGGAEGAEKSEPEAPVPANRCGACGKELPPGPPWCKDNDACIPEWKRVAMKG